MTRIIIDSTIDLPEQYRRQVHIVPLTIHFGTEELLDGVDIDRQRFYERLVESDVLPTTSQPSPDAFAQLFDQVEAAGDSAVVLTISHKLSGTYQSACIAAEGRERIFVVDTMSASIGSGILARYAIDNAHLYAGELAALLERRRQDVCIIGLVDTLEYLKKGGRITPAVAAFAAVLNLKPILQIQGDKLDTFAKARGMRLAETRMIEAVKADRETRFADTPDGALIIAAAGSFEDPEQAERWRTLVQAEFPALDVPYAGLPCSIACHVGMNAVGIAVMKREAP